MMLQGINIGQYLPVSSLIHRIEPRAKLISAALLIIAVIFTDDMAGLITVSLFFILAVRLSGIKPRLYWRCLKPLWLLIVISCLLQVFFTKGESAVGAGFLTVSWQGLASGGWLLWRFSILVLLSAVVTFTTTPLQLTAALEQLLLPLARLGVPVREAAMMINLSLRFIPTLFEEARFLFLAQRSRGANFTRGGVISRVKGLVPFIVPLFTNIFRRADDLSLGIEIRCYRVGAKRSRIANVQFRQVDYIVVLLSAVLLAVVLGERVVNMPFR